MLFIALSKGVQTDFPPPSDTPPQPSNSMPADPPPQSSTCETQTVVTIKPAFRSSDPEIEIKVLSSEFSQLCQKKLDIIIPDDFLVYAGTAMAHLAKNKRSNVVYSLAKGIGTMREDQSGESQFPVNRMPMGLMEYTANFFIAENVNQVSMYSNTPQNKH